MEYVLKAGRGLGSGVCRAASALARGTRRILAYVPLLGIAAVPVAAQDTKLSTVRHSVQPFPERPRGASYSLLTFRALPLPGRLINFVRMRIRNGGTRFNGSESAFKFKWAAIRLG